jgi:hypothetical protein
MPPKHIPTNGQGDAIEHPKLKEYKAKPKPYKEPIFLREYRLERERFMWQKYPEQRAEIEENVKFMKQQWLVQDKRK